MPAGVKERVVLADAIAAKELLPQLRQPAFRLRPAEDIEL